jgi:redox-sensitive bicupin YhaK (pirin superfamily)
MLTLYPNEKLGHADHGWLHARHHFSFARYYNPSRLGFGALRVINDDIIQAGKGFDTHPHDNMEIITYIRQGAIRHQDSAGNTGRTAAGDVQVMSAGTGVLHSEHNNEQVDTVLYQIWIEPQVKNVAPRWEQKEFPKEFAKDSLPLLVSGQEEHKKSGALWIYQDAAIYGGRLAAGEAVTQTIKHQAYILASEGSFLINGLLMNKGDGAELTDEKTITIIAQTDAEILIIDVPE